MKAAELAPGMNFGCWRIVGPACPEYRKGRRYVEASCWGCRLVHEVAADNILSGVSRRCKACALGRRRAILTSGSPEATALRDLCAKRALRLALIRKAAEARA